MKIRVLLSSHYESNVDASAPSTNNHWVFLWRQRLGMTDHIETVSVEVPLCFATPLLSLQTNCQLFDLIQFMINIYKSRFLTKAKGDTITMAFARCRIFSHSSSARYRSTWHVPARHDTAIVSNAENSSTQLTPPSRGHAPQAKKDETDQSVWLQSAWRFGASDRYSDSHSRSDEMSMHCERAKARKATLISWRNSGRHHRR